MNAKKKGFSLIEVIIVITILIAFATYKISSFNTRYVQERGCAYQLKYVCDYCRKYSCSVGRKTQLDISRNQEEQYVCKIKDGENNIIYEEKLGNGIVLYSGENKDSLVPVNKLHIVYHRQHALESEGNLSIYIGSSDRKKVHFKMTIVPTSGRGLVIEEK